MCWLTCAIHVCKCVSKNSSSYIVIVVSPHGQSSAEKTLMSVIQTLLFYSVTNSKHTFSGVLEITNFGPRQKVAMVSQGKLRPTIGPKFATGNNICLSLICLW